MTTIRRRKPRYGYLQILNAVTRDYRVSWRARGLLIELLSYPEGFETTVDELVKKAKRSGGCVEGRDAMRKAATELKQVGYIVNHSFQNELGHWITEQEVTDDPMYDLLAQERVSAGQADDWKSGVGEPGVGKPVVGEPGAIKKTEKKKEGEEGDAHAGATRDPSAGDEPPWPWGVAGGAGFAAPTLASATLIRQVAGRALLPGEHLDAEDHQRLAALAEVVRPVVEAQAGLTWEEYEAWLKQGWTRPDGRRTFRSFSGALAWRLQPEQAQGQAWAWACEQRGAQAPSEAQGERELPQEGAQHHTGTCGIHRTRLTADARCLRCEADATAADRARLPEPPEDVQGDEFEEGFDEVSPEVLTAMMNTAAPRAAGPRASVKELREAARSAAKAGADSVLGRER